MQACRCSSVGRAIDSQAIPVGVKNINGLFEESYIYSSKSGKLFNVNRVDGFGPDDHSDYMLLWESMDNGKTWFLHDKDGNFGMPGEMYPRFLKMSDGRLLLTFTVRENSTDGYPLGMIPPRKNGHLAKQLF